MYFLVVIFKRRCEVFYYFESGKRNSVPCPRINLDQSQGESFILSMVLVVIDIKDKISGMRIPLQHGQNKRDPGRYVRNRKHSAHLIISKSVPQTCEGPWDSFRGPQGQMILMIIPRHYLPLTLCWHLKWWYKSNGGLVLQ